MKISLPMLKCRKKILISLLALWGFLFFFAQDPLVLSCFGLGALLIVYFFTRSMQRGMDALLKKGFRNEKEEWDHLIALFYSLQDRIEEQSENFTNQKEEILESISEGIIATDTSAQVTFINETACKMLQASRDEILYAPLSALTLDLPLKCHELALHALQTSETTVQPWNFKEDLYLHLISLPLVHQSGALLILRDKTADYKMIEMGKAFIANASHELRTPITIIRGFAETLQDLPELSQEMLHKISEKIVHTCGRLDKLVRSLLTLADIENLSKERFKKTNLSLVVENCKHLFLAAHPTAALQIRMPESIPVTADIDLLELAILNILENSVKYSPAKAHIEMWTESLEQEVELHIKDRGIGIPEKDLPRIFDRFYTVDKARSRKSGGAGLGLSIVKTVLEKHGGKVSAISEPSKGSQFTLSFPK